MSERITEYKEAVICDVCARRLQVQGDTSVRGSVRLVCPTHGERPQYRKGYTVEPDTKPAVEAKPSGPVEKQGRSAQDILAEWGVA